MILMADRMLFYIMMVSLRGLLVSVYHVTRVEELGGFEQLVHNVLLVDSLQDVALLYHVVEVGLHELKN